MNPIIIAIRFLLAPLILKWPLFGGGLAILLDNLDWYTKDLFGMLSIGEYESIDKLLDLWYLSFIFVIALKFKNKLIRNVLIGLFIYRVIGTLLFELTNSRILLVLFPNVFENFFFFYYILKKISFREPVIPLGLFAFFLSIVIVLKLIEEYSIHVTQKPLPIILALAYIVGIVIAHRFLLRKTY